MSLQSQYLLFLRSSSSIVYSLIKLTLWNIFLYRIWFIILLLQSSHWLCNCLLNSSFLHVVVLCILSSQIVYSLYFVLKCEMQYFNMGHNKDDFLKPVNLALQISIKKCWFNKSHNWFLELSLILSLLRVFRTHELQIRICIYSEIFIYLCRIIRQSLFYFEISFILKET